MELSPVSRRVEKMDGKDVPIQTKSNGKPLRDKSYQTQQKDERARECVYCEKPDHRSVDCKTVETLRSRFGHLTANGKPRLAVSRYQSAHI